MTATPTRPLALIRLSDLRADDLDFGGRAPNLDDQARRICDWCSARGWPAPEVLVENDLTREGKPKPASAFKRRKVRLPSGRVEYRTVRPVFRDAVDRLTAGRNDALVALDLDRACRDPRDLEDLIDLSEQYGVTVDSVTGSLRLTTDADVTMARVMVAVANKESRDKARRVAASRERRALAGLYGGGRRPYGFEVDGRTRRENECAVVVDAANRLLRGVPLKALARELRQRDEPTTTGAPWSSATLRDILLRPRNAGRMVYRGEVVAQPRRGDDGEWWPWEPIVAPDVHDRVVQLLTDPDRRIGTGNAARWLLSGIARCGLCAPEEVTVQAGRAGGNPIYRCPKVAHMGRSARHVDAWVTEVVLARFRRRDARDLLTPVRAGVDAEALRAERRDIEDNLAEMAAVSVLASGKRAPAARAQLRAANEAAAARLAEIELQLSTADGPDPDLAELVNAADPAEVWSRLPLANQRALVDKLMVVTILPAGRRGPGFDPATVEIVPREVP